MDTFDAQEKTNCELALAPGLEPVEEVRLGEGEAPGPQRLLRRPVGGPGAVVDVRYDAHLAAAVRTCKRKEEKKEGKVGGQPKLRGENMIGRRPSASPGRSPRTPR